MTAGKAPKDWFGCVSSTSLSSIEMWHILNVTPTLIRREKDPANFKSWRIVYMRLSSCWQPLCQYSISVNKEVVIYLYKTVVYVSHVSASKLVPYYSFMDLCIVWSFIVWTNWCALPTPRKPWTNIDASDQILHANAFFEIDSDQRALFVNFVQSH